MTRNILSRLLAYCIMFAGALFPSGRRLRDFFPTSWEQDTLHYLLKPFQVVERLLLFILWPIYKALGSSSLKILASTMNIILAPTLKAVLLFAKVSNAIKFLRPLSFLLALPFLALAYVLLTIQPVEPEENAEKLLSIIMFPRHPKELIGPNKALKPTP